MSNALATRPDTRQLAKPDTTLPDAASFAQLTELAQVIHASQMFPNHKNWQAIFTCMVKGRELGIPATEAMQQIHMIQGKATCSANLMLSLVQRDHGPRAMYIDLQRSNDRQATIVYRDPGTGQMVDYTYTWEMAEAADLAKKPMWKAYPNNMLQWRAVSNVARAVFSGSVAGMYTPEELGANLRFDDDGFAVVEVPGESVQQTGQPATDRQIGYIKGMCRDHNWSRSDLAAYIASTYGVDSLEALDRRQASAIVEFIGSGGRWVDPRQQQLDMSASPPEPEVIEAEAVEVVESGDVDPVYVNIMERLEGAEATAELNEIWKEAVDTGRFSDPTLYALYNRRRHELKGNGGNGGRG